MRSGVASLAITRICRSPTVLRNLVTWPLMARRSVVFIGRLRRDRSLLQAFGGRLAVLKRSSQMADVLGAVEPLSCIRRIIFVGDEIRW